MMLIAKSCKTSMIEEEAEEDFVARARILMKSYNDIWTSTICQKHMLACNNNNNNKGF
jgi:hypothetical protein